MLHFDGGNSCLAVNQFMPSWTKRAVRHERPCEAVRLESQFVDLNSSTISIYTVSFHRRYERHVQGRAERLPHLPHCISCINEEDRKNPGDCRELDRNSISLLNHKKSNHVRKGLLAKAMAFFFRQQAASWHLLCVLLVDTPGPLLTCNDPARN